MARFSLSPPKATTAPQSTEFKWKFPPRDYNDDESEDDTSLDTSSDESTSCHDIHDDDDSSHSSQDEEEPPHPLGFELYGRTRFGLSPSSHKIREVIDTNAWNAPVHISHQELRTPRQSLCHDGIPSSTLLRGITDPTLKDGGMTRIENLLKAASLNETTIPTPRATITPNSKLMQLADAAEREMQSISIQMSQLEMERNQSYQSAVDALMMLLQADKAVVSAAQKRMDERKAQQLAHEKEVQRQIQARQEEEQRVKEEELKELELQKQKEEEEQRAKEERIRSQTAEIQKAEEEAIQEAQAKLVHVDRAKRLVSELDTLRSSYLCEFDKSKLVSRRRLGFKKIVNGKINTLSHEENKIREVASVVVEAIQTAQRDDEAATDNVSKLGKQYLLDLLASNLIVRVQADGFNGTRGDGFPLGAAFALISTQCDLNDVLEGHLYGVCPMAVPVLEMGGRGSDGSEEDRWMESLGMVRDKNGEFETFDKFLSRTEGLISIMANIMSSLPSNHTLLGGHEGALTWLERFLDLIPPPPTKPLPLLTAPVLVAFLTGAGHLLANKFESKFRPLLETIEKEIMDRLDDSPVGVPSATRLKKVMDGGFDGLKKNMPAGAVESLYDGKEGSGTASTALPPSNSAGGAFGTSEKPSGFGQASSGSSPFGQVPQNASTFGQAPSNTSSFGKGPSNTTPFGQAAPSNSSPFGQAPSNTSTFGQTASSNPPPFGQTAQQTTPFGQANTIDQNSMMDNNSENRGGSTANPFSTSSWGTSSGFGTSSASSSPFGTTPAPSAGAFGSQTNSFQQQQQQSTPFGASAPTPSPFGAPAASSFSSNPFGGSAPAPSPFGTSAGFGGSSTQGKSPFSSLGASPFGGGSSNTKKDTRPPCKFFAKGNCRYGANCKFSHGDSAPTSSSSSFSSFGAGFGSQHSNPSPFGGGSNFGSTTPFSNPFGGPRR